MSNGFPNLRQYLAALRARGELAVIDAEVNPDLEVAEIHRRVVEKQGPALLFRNVRGSRFPLVTNLFGTRDRVDLAFGRRGPEAVADLCSLAQEKPSLAALWRRRGALQRLGHLGTRRAWTPPPITRCTLSDTRGLFALPALRQWPQDGGRFLTLPLVYTEHPVTGHGNLGMYRVQFHKPDLAGMHWQIHRGGGFHHHACEKAGLALPTTVFLGGPPALTLAAIAPLPENIPETLFAGFLLGKRIPRSKHSRSPHPLFAEAEFAICGSVPPQVRHPEGPFGDHYGYYSLEHPFPTLQVDTIFHRPDAIFPATVVGRPRQEDFFIGEYIQDLFVPVLRTLIPALEDLHSFGETGFHCLAAARVKNRYHREAMTSAFRLLGEGQLSLQKVLMIGDSCPNIRDFPALLIHFLKRTDWAADLHIISPTSHDTLDYTGPRLNQGSKAIWLALGDERHELATEAPTHLPEGVRNAALFVPGCLVLEAPPFVPGQDFAQRVAAHPALNGWRMVVLVDQLKEALRTPAEFLWTWFTRFEPAADIHCASMELDRCRQRFHAPLVFDSRMKPWYPGVVEPAPETVEQVSRRWPEFGL